MRLTGLLFHTSRHADRAERTRVRFCGLSMAVVLALMRAAPAVADVTSADKATYTACFHVDSGNFQMLKTICGPSAKTLQERGLAEQNKGSDQNVLWKLLLMTANCTAYEGYGELGLHQVDIGKMHLDLAALQLRKVIRHSTNSDDLDLARKMLTMVARIRAGPGGA